MRVRNVLVTLALAAGTANAAALDAGSAPPASEFAAGEKAALAGDAKGAAAAFERSLTHGWAPGTLFDLGNAYASAGDAGRAILAYERARVLAPADPSIAANLAQERAEAGIATHSPSAIDRELAVLTADDWTWLALAGAALACVGFVALGWSRRGGARALIAVGALTALVCGLSARRTAPDPGRAIVLARTAARVSPLPAADVVFTAPAGEAVTVAKRHGEFLYVRDGDRAGWLPRSALERVIPR